VLLSDVIYPYYMTSDMAEPQLQESLPDWTDILTPAEKSLKEAHTFRTKAREQLELGGVNLNECLTTEAMKIGPERFRWVAELEDPYLSPRDRVTTGLMARILETPPEQRGKIERELSKQSKAYLSLKARSKRLRTGETIPSGWFDNQLLPRGFTHAAYHFEDVAAILTPYMSALSGDIPQDPKQHRRTVAELTGSMRRVDQYTYEPNLDAAAVKELLDEQTSVEDRINILLQTHPKARGAEKSGLMPTLEALRNMVYTPDQEANP